MVPSPAIQRGAPRGSHEGTRGGRGRGRGSGERGRGGVARGGAGGTQREAPSISDHITTIGVRRPNFGTAGRAVPILVNSFTTTIPQDIIRHYDGAPPFAASVLHWVF
ncbi:hypothetical protein E1B28_000954 [Marasmius oreades]|uniref:Uncharacterized protein n=1 Tax=Marasmius oreades TaxID=181124 RepID=A0A9P7V2I1_9AGAR|nr:uncharacterized protein E1B28_000954 [Marasmius oreades]KAG7099079.1 hypothetical protein E1B28_000954 [Marasmius oreades]